MLKAQTLSDWVCLLFDDASTDQSAAILTSYIASDRRFTVFSTPHNFSVGPGIARNFLLERVSTGYVAFCDIDDLWHPAKLDAQLSFHKANNLDISVTSYARFSLPRSIPHIHRLITPPSTLNYSRLLRANTIPMLTVISTLSFVEQRFPPIRHEDYAFWLSVFKRKSVQYGCLTEVLSFYRIHDANLTKNRLVIPSWIYQVYRSLGYHPLRSACLLMLWMIARILAEPYQLTLSFFSPSQVRKSRQVLNQLLRQPALLS